MHAHLPRGHESHYGRRVKGERAAMGLRICEPDVEKKTCSDLFEISSDLRFIAVTSFYSFPEDLRSLEMKLACRGSSCVLTIVAKATTLIS